MEKVIKIKFHFVGSPSSKTLWSYLMFQFSFRSGCDGVSPLIIKITIFSIVMGLKENLFIFQVGIGQLNKPITFKVVV